MKCFGSLLIAWLLLGAQTQAAGTLQGVIASTNLTYQISAVDTFQRSNAGFTTPWVVTPGFPGNFEVSSDTAIVSSLTADDNWSYSAVSPPGNQWAGVILGTPGTAADNDGYGVSIAVSTSAQTLYRVTCNQTGFEVYKIVAGAGTSVQTSTGTTCTTGTFLSISLSGGTLTAYKNWVPFYTVSDSSITSGQLGISYSSTDTGGSITQWQGGTFNSGGGSSPPPSGGTLYPQIGIQAFLGTQVFPNANIPQLAEYQWVMLGGNYGGWPAANSSAGGYSTRDQLVVALHGQTGSGGKNAVKPFVIQYQNPSEFNESAPWFIAWENEVSNQNWWVYNSGSSGTQTESIYNSSYTIVNPSHIVGTDGSLYPYQKFVALNYALFYSGTGGSSDGGSAMASTHLDGWFIDNQSARNLAGTAADWERNGTNPSQIDPTATQLTAIGKADVYNYLNSLNPAITLVANTEFGYDYAPTGSGGLGMNPSGMATTGIYKWGEQQFMYGNATYITNAVLNWGGFSTFMTWYQALETNLASGGTPVLTGGFATTDYKPVRYALTATLMRNGVFVSGIGSNQDGVDPSNTSSYPVFDEFWGGTKSLAGYMGAAVAGARGAEQSAAWSNGVWERNYANCAAFSNPVGNGTQTVNPTTLGYTNLYYLDGTQDHTHNPGGSTPVTSLSIAAGDGYILCNTPSP